MSLHGTKVSFSSSVPSYKPDVSSPVEDGVDVLEVARVDVLAVDDVLGPDHLGGRSGGGVVSGRQQLQQLQLHGAQLEDVDRGQQDGGKRHQERQQRRAPRHAGHWRHQPAHDNGGGGGDDAFRALEMAGKGWLDTDAFDAV